MSIGQYRDPDARRKLLEATERKHALEQRDIGKTMGKGMNQMYESARIVVPVIGACIFITSGFLYQYLSWWHPVIFIANFLGSAAIMFPVFCR